ncbi:MAG: hypothetical protein CL912_32540 [Deltaproteobacteria bacterium]|nr:hypothetical protein [Deltaproteobacteria bacterium]
MKACSKQRFPRPSQSQEGTYSEVTNTKVAWPRLLQHPEACSAHANPNISWAGEVNRRNHPAKTFSRFKPQHGSELLRVKATFGKHCTSLLPNNSPALEPKEP